MSGKDLPILVLVFSICVAGFGQSAKPTEAKRGSRQVAEARRPAAATPIDAATVAEAIAIPVAWLQGGVQNVTLDVKVMSKGKKGWAKQADISLTDLGAKGFQVSADGQGQKVVITRTPEETEFALPAKRIVYVGTGAVDPQNALNLRQIAQRMLAQEPELAVVAALATSMSAPDLAAMLVGMFPDAMQVMTDGAGVKHVAIGDPGNEAEVLVKPGRGITQVSYGEGRASVDLRKNASIAAMPATSTKGFAVKKVDRGALERILTGSLAHIGDNGIEGIERKIDAQMAKSE